VRKRLLVTCVLVFFTIAARARDRICTIANSMQYADRRTDRLARVFVAFARVGNECALKPLYR
jgi:hypothetical protein